MFSKKFWADLAERAVASAAGAVVAAVGVDQTVPNALTLDYRTLGGLAAGAAGFSILKALVKLGGATVAQKSAERAFSREVDNLLAENPDVK
jgi:hypothetical protein